MEITVETAKNYIKKWFMFQVEKFLLEMINVDIHNTGKITSSFLTTNTVDIYKYYVLNIHIIDNARNYKELYSAVSQLYAFKPISGKYISISVSPVDYHADIMIHFTEVSCLQVPNNHKYSCIAFNAGKIFKYKHRKHECPHKVYDDKF